MLNRALHFAHVGRVLLTRQRARVEDRRLAQHAPVAEGAASLPVAANGLERFVGEEGLLLQKLCVANVLIIQIVHMLTISGVRFLELLLQIYGAVKWIFHLCRGHVNL